MLSLTDMPAGKKATIVSINGGHDFVQKLDKLGLRTSKEITKVSRQCMKGPVIIRTGNTEIAIAFGIAYKIMVEVQ
jgi:Fe2+ transport system protein FeoA